MKNSLADLNNHLFAQLERLGDEDLSGDALKHEIERSNAIKGIASQVIANAQVVLKAEQLRVVREIQDPEATKFLTGKKEEKLLNG